MFNIGHAWVAIGLHRTSSVEVLAVPKNMKLLAIPLFELYDNAARCVHRFASVAPFSDTHLATGLSCLRYLIFFPGGFALVLFVSMRKLRFSFDRRYNFIYQ